mgnify:CR=1 FL=1
MPSIEYGFSAPFIEAETIEYTDPDTGETVTETVERKRVPIRLYTRKWQQTADNEYKLWFRVTVTEFGDVLRQTGVPSNVTVPDWYGDMADSVDSFIDGIYAGQLPKSEIQSAVQNADVTVKHAQSDGDDLLVNATVEPNSIPVMADFTAATVSFDPTR